jgi:hypothetical protein
VRFGPAHLQEPQHRPLDGELDVQHVALAPLQLGARHAQLLQHVWGECGGDRVRGAGAGHDVLALAVREVLTEQARLAGRRVAGEHHARAGVSGQVAEHHRLHDHRRAEVVRDAVVLAVGPGPPRVPGAQHRLHRADELRPRVAGDALAAVLVERPLARRPHAVVDLARVVVRADGRDELADPVPRVQRAQHRLAVHGVEAGDEIGHEADVADRPGQRDGGGAAQPRLRTVSIIPGIDTGAPERTDSSSGTGPAPNVFPVRSSSAASRANTSSTSPPGTAPSARKRRQASVETT